MAVTFTVVNRNVVGNRRTVDLDITGPASYSTGGEALTAAQLNTIMPEYAGKLAATDSDKILFFQSDTNLSDQHLILDRVNDKIMYFTNAGQVTGTTDLDAVTIAAKLEYKA